MDLRRRRIAVIGGGISGLSLALQLKRSGNEVVLFEASSQPGGKIGTIYKDGFELDLGPVTCVETPALKELLKRLDLGGEITTASAASSMRYIYSRNKLRRIEASPIGILKSSLLPVRGRLAFFKSIFAKRGDEDESVAVFAKRRFGEQAYQKLFNPVLNGVYAGNSEKLSARSTLKSFNNRKRRKIISLKGGLRRLIEAITLQLGGAILTNTTVTAINKTEDGVKVCHTYGSYEFDKVYITTPAFVTANLIKELEQPLKQVHYSSVTQVYCEVVPGETKFEGFGFLVPSEERMSLLGAVCVSNVFPNKAPDDRTLFVLFIGGDRPYPFTATVESAIEEFNKILKPALCRTLHVQRWDKGIPQFYVGHDDIVAALKEFENKNPNICISGNYLTGVAVGDCV
ncbi:MAG TPA: protoporphyrinogen oxidase [Cyclobacteriaceae bacterium]|nr:protoporphyrinogen oxidase [Cyclobacteriaceae bacterium]